jgi:hypothetical protein
MATNRFSRKEELDIDAVEVNKPLDKFKFKQGQKYRVTFPLLNKNGKVRIDRVYYFNKFEDREGGIKIKAIVPEDCTDDQLDKIIAKLGDPVARYVTPICVYTIDGATKKVVGHQVVPFVFADGTLADIKAINEEFPIAECDLIISLKEGTKEIFQNLVILPSNKRLLDKMSDKDTIIREAQDLAKNMHKAVASEMSCAAIMERAGITQTQSAPEEDIATDDVYTEDDDDLV